MVIILAYVRESQASAVLRALHDAGVGGLTAYSVHGMSGERPTFLYSDRPFEPEHLPESVKIELVCSEEAADSIVALIAKEARTGRPGDGMIAVQAVNRFLRISDG